MSEHRVAHRDLDQTGAVKVDYLGKGGAVVYKFKSQNGDMKVLKKIHLGTAWDRISTRREVAIMQKCNCEFLMTIEKYFLKSFGDAAVFDTDLGPDDWDHAGFCYIVMPLAENDLLQEIADRGPLHEREAQHVIIQLLLAMHHLHREQLEVVSAEEVDYNGFYHVVGLCNDRNEYRNEQGVKITFDDGDGVWKIMCDQPQRRVYSISSQSLLPPGGVWEDDSLVGCVVHESVIAHRDIKAENVFIRGRTTLDDGTKLLKIWLADFGFGKSVDSSTGEPVKTYFDQESPSNVAPEARSNQSLSAFKCDNSCAYDCSCDFWSLGHCAFTMMVGQKPFAEDYDERYRAGLKAVGMPSCDSMAADPGFKFKFSVNCQHDAWNALGNRWDSLTEEARNFVRHLLCVQPGGRLNMTACARHRWIQEYFSQSSVHENWARKFDLMRNDAGPVGILRVSSVHSDCVWAKQLEVGDSNQDNILGPNGLNVGLNYNITVVRTKPLGGNSGEWNLDNEKVLKNCEVWYGQYSRNPPPLSRPTEVDGLGKDFERQLLAAGAPPPKNCRLECCEFVVPKHLDGYTLAQLKLKLSYPDLPQVVAVVSQRERVHFPRGGKVLHCGDRMLFPRGILGLVSDFQIDLQSIRELCQRDEFSKRIENGVIPRLGNLLRTTSCATTDIAESSIMLPDLPPLPQLPPLSNLPTLSNLPQLPNVGNETHTTKPASMKVLSGEADNQQQ